MRRRLMQRPVFLHALAATVTAGLLLLAAASACLAECAGTGGIPSTGCGNADASGAAGVSASAAAAEVAHWLTAGATPGSNNYRIGPLDMLDVSVFKVPDLSKTVQVGDDGQISYPLVGEVPAAGKTTHELERELAKRLGDKYLRSPQVTVLVREYNSQRVTVEGAVKNSGVYAMKGRTSLVQAIAMAGGIDSTIGSGDVVIFRTIDGQRAVARFDIDAVKKGDAEDPQLRPGDVVVTDTSSTKVVLHNILSVLPITTASGVFVPLLANNKASIAETNLASASVALSTLTSERIKNEQLWKQIEVATAINLARHLSNGTIETLRSKRNALQTEYQAKLETFKPSYPAMMQISDQIAEIDRQLAAELKALKASYKAAYESSLRQEEDMRRRVESLKAEVLDLQKRNIHDTH
jgi:polysaccharide biosynthesis/export protein